VAELEADISEAELGEWMAYCRLYPFGEEFAFWDGAQVSAMVANVNRDPKKSKPASPLDYVPGKAQAARRGTRRNGTDPVLVKASLMDVFGDRFKTVEEKDAGAD